MARQCRGKKTPLGPSQPAVAVAVAAPLFSLGYQRESYTWRTALAD